MSRAKAVPSPLTIAGAAIVSHEPISNSVLLADILAHLEELEDAWLRGAIHEHDCKGGMRSNRNVELARRLRKILPAAPVIRHGENCPKDNKC